MEKAALLLMRTAQDRTSLKVAGKGHVLALSDWLQSQESFELLQTQPRYLCFKGNTFHLNVATNAKVQATLIFTLFKLHPQGQLTVG